MRKSHKKQLLELIATLDDACCELREQKEQSFLSLCAEVQEFVSGIFDYVEEVLDAGSPLSGRLKELYEMLYNASMGKASAKQILKAVRKIGAEAASLTPDQIEVVFFCYKASMSDSFESVYLAAKEDPSCDVFFVPIPYFDRNPNGGVSQAHLEGAAYYPDQYELTDWQSYDVETRRPDVIFIMNPYDGNNHVTSVHPDFYSSRLKKFTDLLVYIEYGIPLWMHRDSDAALETIKENGVLLPVYFNCDYYIAYSKEIAAYFKTLFRVNRNDERIHNLTPQKIKEKFVPLGSPKFDKVLAGKRENYILPEEWREKIGEKKVVLYNTGLTEFLKASVQQGDEAGDCIYFQKLRSILEAFRSRDDVVLWWRPHPLFEATLSSMRASLLDEYQAIVRNFKTLDIGLLDTTEDLHKAIAWSDAMISDESSLLFLYMATGKPFYIPSITMARPNPIHDTGTDFHAPLAGRLRNMRSEKGANIGNINTCIWWHNFLDEDLKGNTHFDNFNARFIDYVVHPEKYPEASEYQALQVQMFSDFVANADGTAGQKIYEFVKQKAQI